LPQFCVRLTTRWKRVALPERDEQLPELTAHLIAAQYAASMGRAIDEVFGVLSLGLNRA
jgi:hypothetical protein